MEQWFNASCSVPKEKPWPMPPGNYPIFIPPILPDILSFRERESEAGTLEIGFSLSKINARIGGLKRDILLVTLGVVGIGTLFTLIFTRLLIHPIEKLASATERVAKGELASRVHIRSRDEIGDLANAFNQMTLQIQESQEDLEKKVEERTRELEKANLEFKELDETRMKFIGIASHELKTPLTAIKSNVDFILSEKEGRLSRNI